MMTDPVRRALDFLLARRNPDGGWGYRPGRRSLVEPTGLGLLALTAGGEKSDAAAGLDFLRSCRKGSGAVGIDPSDPEGSWMAYAAILAFDALGAADESRRLAEWALAMEDASGRFTADEISSIAMTYRYDAAIPGWPWTPGTTAWVEPTAQFMIALIRAGISPEHERLKSGVRLLVDRRVRSGGWNFGNPYSQTQELEASPMSTALALAALGAAGYPGDRPAVREGLRYLDGALAGDVSTVSLAWAGLALKCYPHDAPGRPDPVARLSALQAGNGGFRDNLFETALAAIVLSDPARLVRTPGRAG